MNKKKEGKNKSRAMLLLMLLMMMNKKSGADEAQHNYTKNIFMNEQNKE